MKKILTKTNISLLMLMLCAVLIYGVFAINTFTSKKSSVTAFQEGTSATLLGATEGAGHSSGVWWKQINYHVTNLIITNSFDTGTAADDPVDVSEKQDQSLYAYKVDNGDGTYNCVIYADVQTIYAPFYSYRLFSGWDGADITNLYYTQTITFQNNCFSTINVTNMEAMFGSCVSLESIYGFDALSTDNVTTMENMFIQCYQLESVNVSNFNTHKVATMNSMFKECINLVAIDVSNFNTNSLTSTQTMFYDCRKLTDLKIEKTLIDDSNNVYSWNTKNVSNMIMMFGNCLSLNKIDVGHFEIDSIESFDNIMLMFGGCRSLETLNIASFDFSSLENTDLHLIGMSDELVIAMMSITLQDGQSLDEYIDQIEESEGLGEGSYHRHYRNPVNLKEIYTPKAMGTNKIYMPKNNKLYLNGEESKELQLTTNNFGDECYAITNEEQGQLISVLKSEKTPSTGFVDEQLLPMIAVAIVSVLAVVCLTGAIKKRKNRI